MHSRVARVCAVTAKDKLRNPFGKGLAFGDGTATSFFAVSPETATMDDHGIGAVLDLVGLPVPDVHSAGLSEFVLATDVMSMARDRPDIMYLSTADWIRHLCAPGTPVANALYEMKDGYLAQPDETGSIITITADHGRNTKRGSDDLPDVICLQELLDDMFGKGKAHVTRPITDPYVVPQ